MNRCPGTKRDGSGCTVSVEPPQTYCWWHDPTNAAVRKQAASRGGKRAGRGRPQAEITSIKEQLQDLADRILGGDLDRADGAVVSQILNVKLRAISTELAVREQLELIERMEALEAAYFNPLPRSQRTGAATKR